MSSASFLPEAVATYVEIAKQELIEIRLQILRLTPLESPQGNIDLFFNHRIDHILFEITDYLDKHAKEHRLTPAEIDKILHAVMQDFLQVLKPGQLQQSVSPATPKRLIDQFLSKFFFFSKRHPDHKNDQLYPLLHAYIHATRFEKESLFQAIKSKLRSIN